MLLANFGADTEAAKGGVTKEIAAPAKNPAANALITRTHRDS